MTETISRTTRVPAYTVLVAGIIFFFAGMSGNSMPLDVVGCAAMAAGTQALLWSGALVGYPRKRVAAILASVLSSALGLFLVGIRLYAGPAAWSG